MSSEIAIKVEGVSKCYQIYDTPRDRLKQFILPRVQRYSGASVQQYYKEFWALDDVSFEVKKGESVGILGRNGSGKSTLLQMICGTLSPTLGKIETHGRIAALLELGSGFNPDFTGRENVYMNGALLGLTTDQIDNRYDAIAAFADIGEFIEQPVKTYSSGMMIRLAFAVQVQVEPDILIIDEALAVGDALFQKRCFQRIEKLVSDGTTLLFVSHDQESVRTLTNRALLLKQGKPLAWGLSSEVVLEYRRQLHDDESKYYAMAVKRLSEKAKAAPERPPNEREPLGDLNINVGDSNVESSRADKLSFGDGDVKVLGVKVLNEHKEESSYFYPGDKLEIVVTCEAAIKTDKLNVALRIRNKEGVKVYSWGTLNQDIVIWNLGSEQKAFWDSEFTPGQIFSVSFTCDCPLGVNLYEVQASVSLEETPDYMSQRILHWIDEAAFFHVGMKRDEYFFGGLFDLRMKASW